MAQAERERMEKERAEAEAAAKKTEKSRHDPSDERRRSGSGGTAGADRFFCAVVRM